MGIFNKTITKPLPEGGEKRVRIHRRSLWWMVSLVLVLLADRLIPAAFWENWYYEGLFRWIRIGYDFLLGWSPVPMIYLVLAVVVARVWQWFGEWDKKFLYQASRAIGGLAAIVVLFYVLWAFNYHQRPLPKRLGFDFKSVSLQDIETEFVRASDALRHEAISLRGDLTSDEAILHKRIKEPELRKDVKTALRSLDLPSGGNVRVRQVWPKGALLRWSTAGIYIPQAGEGHIDMALLSVQKPFTMAHEMAHGFGVTDEADCNFIAWLACLKSPDPWTRYSGALVYWRYTAAEMSRDSVEQMLRSFPPVVEHSLDLIRQNDHKYPDLMPKLRDQIYSSYLKHHGVEGGLRSYNRVVLLVQQYMQRKND